MIIQLPDLFIMSLFKQKPLHGNYQEGVFMLFLLSVLNTNN